MICSGTHSGKARKWFRMWLQMRGLNKTLRLHIPFPTPCNRQIDHPLWAGDWSSCTRCRHWAEEALELRTQGMALGRAVQSAILKSVGLSENPLTTQAPLPSTLSLEIPKTKKRNYFYLEKLTSLRGNTDRKDLSNKWLVFNKPHPCSLNCQSPFWFSLLYMSK